MIEEQDYFGEIKRILHTIDIKGDVKGFQCMVFMTDEKRKKSSFWAHVYDDEVTELLLYVMRKNSLFAERVAKAVKILNKEKKENESKNQEA